MPAIKPTKAIIRSCRSVEFRKLSRESINIQSRRRTPALFFRRFERGSLVCQPLRAVNEANWV